MGTFSHYPRVESTIAFSRESSWSLKEKCSKIVMVSRVREVGKLLGGLTKILIQVFYSTDAYSPVEEKHTLLSTPVQEV